MSEAILHVLGALALELTPGSAAARDALPQREAGELGAAIARDLAKFSPEAATLDLTTAGTHYDPVELLRPGWPVHRELDQLGARAPGGRGERSEEHTTELQSLMRISYAVFCLQTKTNNNAIKI